MDELWVVYGGIFEIANGIIAEPQPRCIFQTKR